MLTLGAGCPWRQSACLAGSLALHLLLCTCMWSSLLDVSYQRAWPVKQAAWDALLLPCQTLLVSSLTPQQVGHLCPHYLAWCC